MPTIPQIVAQIRTAVFGKDVRESIAQGIEACHTENTTAATQLVQLKSAIADDFDTSTDYTAGKCVFYTDGKLYRFNTDHDAGAWNSTEVDEVNIADHAVFDMANGVTF